MGKSNFNEANHGKVNRAVATLKKMHDDFTGAIELFNQMDSMTFEECYAALNGKNKIFASIDRDALQEVGEKVFRKVPLLAKAERIDICSDSANCMYDNFIVNIPIDGYDKALINPRRYSLGFQTELEQLDLQKNEMTEILYRSRQFCKDASGWFVSRQDIQTICRILNKSGHLFKARLRISRAFRRKQLEKVLEIREGLIADRLSFISCKKEELENKRRVYLSDPRLKEFEELFSSLGLKTIINE